MLYLLLQMCLVLKLWVYCILGRIYILQETFTLNSDTVNLDPQF